MDINLRKYRAMRYLYILNPSERRLKTEGNYICLYEHTFSEGWILTEWVRNDSF